MFKITGQVPPDSGNLTGLLQKAHIQVGEKDRELLDLLMNFQAALRYPVHDSVTQTVNQAFYYLERSRE